MSWIKKDQNNNIVSVMNTDPSKILHENVAKDYEESENEYIGGFFIDGKLVKENEKNKVEDLFEHITNKYKLQKDFGTEVFNPNIEFDKVLNFTAFMLRLTNEQREKFLNYKKYAIDEQISDDIEALLGAFHTLNGLSTKSKVFTDGIAALVRSNIIEPGRINYIVG